MVLSRWQAQQQGPNPGRIATLQFRMDGSGENVEWSWQMLTGKARAVDQRTAVETPPLLNLVEVGSALDKRIVCPLVGNFCGESRSVGQL